VVTRETDDEAARSGVREEDGAARRHVREADEADLGGVLKELEEIEETA
jgi:putative ABC transport system ATP-binding protein